MSDAVPTAHTPVPSEEGPSPEAGSETPVRSRAGEPAPPGSFEGRARSFRERQRQQRSRRRERIGQLLVVAIIALGVYAIVSARPFNPSAGSGTPSPGPPIAVNFTAPVLGQVACGQGGTAYTERVVWSGATATVTTGDISPRVYELFDGDILSDLGVVANVTVSSVCAGAPPDAATYSWYVVMEAPNGTIQLTYTFSHGWTSVTQGAWNFPIEDGSAMIVVSGTSFAEKGFGFAVLGFSGGSVIRGSVPL